MSHCFLGWQTWKLVFNVVCDPLSSFNPFSFTLNMQQLVMILPPHLITWDCSQLKNSALTRRLHHLPLQCRLQHPSQIYLTFHHHYPSFQSTPLTGQGVTLGAAFLPIQISICASPSRHDFQKSHGCFT